MMYINVMMYIDFLMYIVIYNRLFDIFKVMIVVASN